MKKILLFMLLLVGVESIFANDLAVKRKPKKGKYKNYDPRKTLFYFGGGLMALPIRGYNFSSVSGNESVLKYAYKPEKVTPILVHVNVGKQLRLKAFNPDLSVGLEPNIKVGYGSAGKVKSVIYGDFSLYASMRWGAGSNLENERILGFGLGIGGSARAMKMEYVVDEHVNITPSVYGEIRFRHKDDIYYLRLFADVVPYQYEFETYTGNILGPKWRLIGIQVMRD
jgi:hypothetical protein